jgi:hypothetical protein
MQKTTLEILWRQRTGCAHRRVVGPFGQLPAHSARTAAAATAQVRLKGKRILQNKGIEVLAVFTRRLVESVPLLLSLGGARGRVAKPLIAGSVSSSCSSGLRVAPNTAGDNLARRPRRLIVL